MVRCVETDRRFGGVTSYKIAIFVWKNHVMDLVRRPLFFKSTTFRTLDLFPSSGKKKLAPTLLRPLETSSLSHWTSDLVSESCFWKTLGDGKGP
jgi:hypothetical protein